jgi:signal transduction histidine kinase
MDGITKKRILTTRQVGDLSLAVAFIAMTQIEVWVFALQDGHSITTRVGAALLTTMASGALAWRRSRPAFAYWINAAGVVGTIAIGFPGDIYQWTNLIAIYTVSAYGTSWDRWLGLPAGIAGVSFYFVRFPDEGGITLAAFVVAIWVVGWLAGRIYGARLDQIQLRHEMELSRQLAEANEQRLATEEERMRIARELHDIIGHTVNVMVVHAGAGRREVGGDNDLVRQAFDTIETTGRTALGELDRVLAVLRRDEVDPDRQPAPGLGDLDGLADVLSETGLEVDVKLSGEFDVPASVSLAAYRIVQEALTNSLRHSQARRATVAVSLGDGHLELKVSDDGDGDPMSIEPGRGITGMQERAAVHDGRLELDRSEEGGLEVRARLNWRPAS